MKATSTCVSLLVILISIYISPLEHLYLTSTLMYLQKENITSILKNNVL